MVLEAQDLPGRRDQPDSPVLLVQQEVPEFQEHRDQPVPPDRLDRLVLKELREHWEVLGHLESVVCPVRRAQLDQLDHRDFLDPTVWQEAPDLQEVQELLVQVDQAESLEHPDNKVHKARLVRPEHPDQAVCKEGKDLRDHPALRGSRGLAVPLEIQE